MSNFLDVAGGEILHDNAYLRLNPEMIDRLIAILNSAKLTGREEVDLLDSHGEGYTLKVIVVAADDDTPTLPIQYRAYSPRSRRLEDA